MQEQLHQLSAPSPMQYRNADNNQYTWFMPSSSGRERVDFLVLPGNTQGDTWVCSVVIEGLFWQRDSPFVNGPLVTDFNVQLPQVLIGRSALGELANRLVEWQAKPVDFCCDIGAGMGSGQTLQISIGQTPDLICSAGKTAFTLTYHCGPSMRGQWAFAVDQSCISLCANGIGEFLGSS